MVKYTPGYGFGHLLQRDITVNTNQENKRKAKTKLVYLHISNILVIFHFSRRICFYVRDLSEILSLKLSLSTHQREKCNKNTENSKTKELSYIFSQ